MPRIKWQVIGKVPSYSGGDDHVIKIHPVTKQIGCDCMAWRFCRRIPRSCDHTRAAVMSGMVKANFQEDIDAWLTYVSNMTKAGYFWCEEKFDSREKAEKKFPNGRYLEVDPGVWTAFTKQHVEH